MMCQVLVTHVVREVRAQTPGDAHTACPRLVGTTQGGPLGPRFFFLLRTALKDRPKGPSTANHQPPPTANCRQPPAATNRQPPTTANRHQPPIPNHQLPPTTINRHQPPTTASRQSPIANRQPPTANTWCARGHFWETGVQEHFFFFLSLKTALPQPDPAHTQHRGRERGRVQASGDI